MKNGLDIQEKADINIDGSHIMKAQHEEDLSVEADQEEAIEMHHDWMLKMSQKIDYTKCPKCGSVMECNIVAGGNYSWRCTKKLCGKTVTQHLSK